MKTEEPNTRREEVNEMNQKPAKLIEEELAQVTGGATGYEYLRQILDKLAGVEENLFRMGFETDIPKNALYLERAATHVGEVSNALKSGGSFTRALIQLDSISRDLETVDVSGIDEVINELEQIVEDLKTPGR